VFEEEIHSVFPSPFLVGSYFYGREDAFFLLSLILDRLGLISRLFTDAFLIFSFTVIRAWTTFLFPLLLFLG